MVWNCHRQRRRTNRISDIIEVVITATLRFVHRLTLVKAYQKNWNLSLAHTKICRLIFGYLIYWDVGRYSWNEFLVFLPIFTIIESCTCIFFRTDFIIALPFTLFWKETYFFHQFDWFFPHRKLKPTNLSIDLFSVSLIHSK